MRLVQWSKEMGEIEPLEVTFVQGGGIFGMEGYTVVRLSGNSGIIDSYTLSQNYPNPFNPETTINFKMLKREIVSVCIYNIRGELIETLIDSRMLTPGCYSAVWNAVNRSAGVYLFRVQTEYEMKTGKMILLK